MNVSINPIQRLFNPKELNMLLSGGGEDGASGTIDVDDLRRYVRYSGGYREDSTTVKLFWKV
jgi:ubiquitin-protein ligase E3 C